MIKVKIFKGDVYEHTEPGEVDERTTRKNLEELINEWLAEQAAIEIIDIKYTHSSTSVASALIIYKN